MHVGTEPTPDLPLSEIYIDESSQTKHRYLVLGGLILPVDCAKALAGEIGKLKASENITAEMKWGRVNSRYYGVYKDLVDLFFDCPFVGPPFDFHSLVVDTTLVNHRAFNSGNKETGFNKEIYQLIKKFARLYRETNYNVYLDHRESSQSTLETRLIVNRGIMATDRSRDWPVRRLHMRDSKKTLILQLVDILLGGVAYQLNGHHQMPQASVAKVALSRHITNRAGIRTVFSDTSIGGKFTIWHRQLRKR